MGMDVFGKAPKSDEGDYFRANVWSWYPILDLIQQAGVLPDEMVEMMGYNDGAGPDDEGAVALADALEAMLGDASDDGVVFSTEDNRSRGTAAVAYGLLGALSGLTGEEQPPMFSTNIEHIRRFITFCRQSGGFEVH